MQISPGSAAPYYPPGIPQARQAECVYRSLTVIAMLLLLASLWVF